VDSHLRGNDGCLPGNDRCLGGNDRCVRENDRCVRANGRCLTRPSSGIFNPKSKIENPKSISCPPNFRLVTNAEVFTKLGVTTCSFVDAPLAFLRRDQALYGDAAPRGLSVRT
jgi:hypothetical protein